MRESVTLTLGARQITLRADVNALCEFEGALNRAGFDPVREMRRFERGDDVPLVTARAMIWALARDRHPDMTLKEAGDLLQTHGVALIGAVTEALRLAAPEADGAAGGESAPGKTTPPPA